MKKYELDHEEEELSDSFESGEWQSIDNLAEKKKEYEQIAKNALKKNKRINIRISQLDLDNLQRVAMREGIPYQTLISSVIHKYVNNYLQLPSESHNQ